MLIDIHCHLASPTLAGEMDGVVERAIAAGVTRMVTIGTDLEDCQICIDLAERYPQIYAAVGIHPCSVTEVDTDDWLDQVAAWAAHPKVVAIGEIGLDYYHDAPDGWTTETYHQRQKTFLERQLELAVQLGKNVVVHNRESWDDTVDMVRAYNGKLRAVFHCHTSAWAATEPLIAANHLVSFTGIATFKNAATVREAATAAVPGQFMLETDAPYLAPVPHRGKRCEPAHVRHTAEAIAQFRGESLEHLAAHTTETARDFFGGLGLM